MKNQWSDKAAQDAVEKYGAKGVNRDLALRVYTTRLLGRVPELVLHGGGNTSVKTTMKDTLGEDVEVLCVKGSGWDMGVIEPPGLPAVRLEPLPFERFGAVQNRRVAGPNGASAYCTSTAALAPAYFPTRASALSRASGDSSGAWRTASVVSSAIVCSYAARS